MLGPDTGMLRFQSRVPAAIDSGDGCSMKRVVIFRRKKAFRGWRNWVLDGSSGASLSLVKGRFKVPPAPLPGLIDWPLSLRWMVEEDFGGASWH